MNIRILPNGNLEMTADTVEQKELAERLEMAKLTGTSPVALEAEFIAEYLVNPMNNGVCYEQVLPEDVGALTDAPLISDGTNVYGFMDYQVKDLLTELVEGNPTIWQKG